MELWSGSLEAQQGWMSADPKTFSMAALFVS
jgi:hypothetical protein